jgi:succinate dehydrogenase/fumarate reductase flavoprotein subunit
MADWDPARMEFSTRDLTSIGIMNEILEGRGGPDGGVYYSLAHPAHQPRRRLCALGRQALHQVGLVGPRP